MATATRPALHRASQTQTLVAVKPATKTRQGEFPWIGVLLALICIGLLVAYFFTVGGFELPVIDGALNYYPPA